ncbi:hypothetical protein, partial [Kitasatospora sp. DSM 101779]|uniref:hypothetical protein n=1 Tax=Kitasatospora sp. DSM 101779 TaxID=2853165 RepID=UPI0021D7D25F
MEGFDAVADRLYTLPPGGFTAARTAAAAEARRAGDRALATRIGALRRPTRSAWAVNLLVHTRPEQARALLDLGGSLRRAQAELAGPALRELSAERRRLVAALTTQARDAAAEAGEPLGEAPLREVEQSLRAALADEAAAEAFAAGRLTAPLEEGGILPTGGLPAAWGEPPAEPAAKPRPEARAAAKRGTVQDTGAKSSAAQDTRAESGAAGGRAAKDTAASGPPAEDTAARTRGAKHGAVQDTGAKGPARTDTTAKTRTAAGTAERQGRRAQQEARRQRAEAEHALAEAEQRERAAEREHT